MKKSAQVKTKRLYISPLTDSQLEQAAASEQDEHMKAAYGEMLSGCRSHPESRLWYTEWLISLRDGTVVGGIGFKGVPDEFGEVEFGYATEPEYRRKGYMTEACAAMCEWAFSHGDVFFVTAETEPYNAASQGLLKKIGFTEYGMGEEGPRFERERSGMSWSAVYMLFGVSIGLSLGMATDNAVLPMLIGAAIGAALGFSFDAAAKKKLRDKRTAREEKRGNGK